MTLEFSEFLAELKLFRSEYGLSINAIAIGAGVPYSQVYGWLRDDNIKTKRRLQKSANKVKRYIANYHKSDVCPLPEEIEVAVRSVWDGKKRSAETIANVIYALKPVLNLKQE